jgi:hypothetical protein
MKTQLNVSTWQANESFEVIPQHSQFGLHRYPAQCAEKFQSLKDKIASEMQWRFASVRPQLLRLAVNEAAALAAITPFPALFLPVLAEEKAHQIFRWEEKQRMIRERSLLEAA